MSRKNGYFDYLSGLMYQGDVMGFLNAMCANIDSRKIENRNKQAGIKIQGEFYGVPSKGIDFKYDMLDFDGKFYKGRADELDHVFNSDGKLLLSANKYDYLGKDIFIVYPSDEKGRIADYGSLYKNGEKMTDDFFRSQSMTKFKEDSDFCVAFFKDDDESGSCVINTDCKIVFEKIGLLNYLYTKKNVVSCEKSYYNLFTGELICKSNYSSPLDTDNFLFVKEYDGTQVYKINLTTCEFEITGEAKIKPVANDVPISNKTDITASEVLPDVLKQAPQGRNDLCKCKTVDEKGKRKKI